MPISSLNKVINLFIVGLSVVLIIVLFTFGQITAFLKSDEIKSLTAPASDPIMILVITLLILSVAVFLGLIVESIASILRGFFRPLYENRYVVTFLRCKKSIENTKLLEARFNRLFNTSSYRRNDQKDTLMAASNTADETTNVSRELQRENRTLAVGLFFHTAKPEHVDWTIQHYSMYVLATNYIVLLFVGIVLVVLSNHSFSFKVIFSVCDLVAMYLLLHTAIDRFFYSYEIAYRHGAIVLCEPKDASKAVGA